MGTRGMDKYTRIKQIGEGSFGKALLVRSKETGKQLVVKEINMGKVNKIKVIKGCVSNTLYKKRACFNQKDSNICIGTC